MALNGLTGKRENFCRAFVKLGVGADAYRSAFNTSSMKDSSIHVAASKLMAEPKIRQRIEELKAMADSESVMTRQEALERLSMLGRADLKDLVEFGQYEIGEDGDGNPVIQSSWRIKDSALQDPAKMASISELTAGKEGIKIKTHNPISAIQQLAKMQGWEAASKHEVTGAGGGPIKVKDVTEYSDEDLAKLIADDD